MTNCPLTEPDPKHPEASRGLDRTARPARTTGTTDPKCSPSRRAVVTVGSLTAAGALLSVAGPAAADTSLRGQKRTLDGNGATASPSPTGGTPRPDVPHGTPADFVPAAYVHLSDDPGDYSNYDLGERGPADIDYIVIHDTEETYEGTLKIFQDPTSYTAAHYVVRQDGFVTQMVENKNVCWHAGNWHVNSRSIGIEMVGWAEQKDQFTTAQYRAVGRLLRHLSAKYRVPLDRGHVIGHSEVPGTTAAGQPDMHWDPGPFYSFERLFAYAGVRLAGAGHWGGRIRDAVQVLPDDRSNVLPFDKQDGSGALGRVGSASLRLYSEPAAEDSKLLADPSLHPSGAGTLKTNDWGDQATQGQVFAVTGRDGDWLEIAHSGTRAFLKRHDATGRPQVTAAGHGARFVVGRSKRSSGAQSPGAARNGGRGKVAVYGQPLPGEAAFKKAGVDVVAPSALQYQLDEGERYAFVQRLRGTYFNAVVYGQPGFWVTDDSVWYQIRVGHRMGYVRAEDVRIV